MIFPHIAVRTPILPKRDLNYRSRSAGYEHGLYSSLLTYWRRERANGILEALTPQKRGPKSKHNPLEEEVQKLLRQNARLTEDLRKAHIIIDVQKKVAALLGHPIPDPDPEEKS